MQTYSKWPIRFPGHLFKNNFFGDAYSDWTFNWTWVHIEKIKKYESSKSVKQINLLQKSQNSF